MTQWIVQPSGLIEPVPAPEFYIDGIGAIELFGACVRMHLFSHQMPLEGGNSPAQKVVMVKIIRPVNTLPCSIGQVAKCLFADGVPITEIPGPYGPGCKPQLVR